MRTKLFDTSRSIRANEEQTPHIADLCPQENQSHTQCR